MTTLRYFDNIRFGSYTDLEVLVDPADNSLWVGQPSVARMMGYSNDNIHDKTKSRGFTEFAKYLGVQICTKLAPLPDSLGRPNKITLINLEACEALLAFEYASGKYELVACLSGSAQEYAAKYAHWRSGRTRKKEKTTEAKVRDALATMEHGATEVSCPSGSIDVLTHSEVIEVKKFQHWKAAMGQALAYQYFYPSHTARIHLSGKPGVAQQRLIEQVCRQYSVRVTWANR